MNLQFRTALNGFNKQDVVACIQALTDQHSAEILSLKNEISSLKDQLAAALENSETNEKARIQAEEALSSFQTDSAQHQNTKDAELEAYRRAESTQRAANEKLQDAESRSAEMLSQAQAKLDEAEQARTSAQIEALRILDSAKKGADRILSEAEEKAQSAEQASEEARSAVSAAMDSFNAIMQKFSN